MHQYRMTCLSALVGGSLLAALPAVAYGQNDRGNLPEVDLAYRINVTVDRTGGYTGNETIIWRNVSDATVDFVPLHLYLNGFSNGSSTWLRESSNDQLRFGEGEDKQVWGYTEPVKIVQVHAPLPSVSLPGEPLDTTEINTDAAVSVEAREIVEPIHAALEWYPIAPDDGNPFDRSLIKVKLDNPVGPGETLTLNIDFEGQLPEPVIARSGCAEGEEFCFYGQWYPQLGARELPGVRGAAQAQWNAHQFHSATEFYNNFADFEVTINAPEDFKIGATGRRIADEDAGEGRRQVTHRQEAVTNFAFVVADMEEHTRTFSPEGGGPELTIRLLAAPGMDFEPERGFMAVEGSLNVLGTRVGPYPYDVLTVVYPTFNGGAIGGMEYPTLITGIFVDPLFKHPLFKNATVFEMVDVHEFGHQYFMGLLASNEADEAYMDEGFNTYWEWEIMDTLFTPESALGSILGRPIDNKRYNEFALKGGNEKFRESLAKQPSWLFEPGTSGNQFYPRTGATLRTAKHLFGQDVMDAVFSTYYDRFAFNHPTTKDFIAVAYDVGGDEVGDYLFEAIHAPRAPDYSVELARTKAVRVPSGRYILEGGTVIELPAEETDMKPDWLDMMGAGKGMIAAEIRDPGYADQYRFRKGKVINGAIPIIEVGEPEGEPTFHESYVRLSGSAWEHLPVTVDFTFADGTVAREVWDGKAAWRAYTLLSPSALVKVEVDPDDLIVIDADPSNDFKMLVPDPATTANARGWGAFVGTFFGLIANGAMSWL